MSRYLSEGNHKAHLYLCTSMAEVGHLPFTGPYLRSSPRAADSPGGGEGPWSLAKPSTTPPVNARRDLPGIADPTSNASDDPSRVYTCLEDPDLNFCLTSSFQYIHALLSSLNIHLKNR